jgi:hypothetical protein
MNARLKTAPVPAREIVPDLSPQLDSILSRALERNPDFRYGSAQEFACDLAHQDQVGLAGRAASGGRKPSRQLLPKEVLLYGALAAVPAMIFALMFYVARIG